MILFFDACSTHGYIGLFNMEREEITSEKFYIAGNESSKAINIIDSFLTAHNQSYANITNIICVVGPGSFTGIRTISLIVNTLSFMYPHISLTPLSFFDLYENYPIVKTSSKRDLFVKYEKGDIIQIEKNIDFEENFSGNSVYGDIDVSIFTKSVQVRGEIDYLGICKKLELQNQSRLAPLYIKKPNIS